MKAETLIFHLPSLLSRVLIIVLTLTALSVRHHFSIQGKVRPARRSQVGERAQSWWLELSAQGDPVNDWHSQSRWVKRAGSVNLCQIRGWPAAGSTRRGRLYHWSSSRSLTSGPLTTCSLCARYFSGASPSPLPSPSCSVDSEKLTCGHCVHMSLSLLISSWNKSSSGNLQEVRAWEDNETIIGAFLPFDTPQLACVPLQGTVQVASLDSVSYPPCILAVAVLGW